MSTQRGQSDYTYFRSVRRPQKVCAVRSEDTFPAALRPSEWVRCILGAEEGDWPQGFDPHVAEFACSFQGFYLFNLGARTTHGPASAAPSTTRSA